MVYSIGKAVYQVECQQAGREADNDRFKPLETVILKSLDNGIDIEVAFALVVAGLIEAVDYQLFLGGGFGGNFLTTVVWV